ncbi:MAG: response regulator [Ignavibacteria bacterium]
MKILIIEDDRNVRDNIKILLEEEQYNVLTAENGSKGVKLAKEIIPDLIICDIMMPKKNGYEVLEELSNTPETLHIPFLFLTAKNRSDEMRKGMNLGADDYLTKPFKTNDFLSAIEVRLKKSKKIKEQQITTNTKEKIGKKYDINDSIFISVNNKPVLLKIREIKLIKAENQYCNIITDQEKYLVRKSLNSWMTILPDNVFKRVHRSTILNVDYILKIEKWFKNTLRIVVKDYDETVNVSKRYAAKLKSSFI